MAISYHTIVDEKGRLVFLMYSVKGKNVNMAVEGVKHQVNQLVFMGTAEVK